MPITCPACNKADQASLTCARCGCDLSLLHAIVESALVRLQTARRALATGDYHCALREAGQSWRLCQTWLPPASPFWPLWPFTEPTRPCAGAAGRK
jgi:hypothetical protein